MKVFKVKATNKVVGELVLSSVAPTCVLKAGKELSLSEKQYWADDIQRCLATKRLVLMEGSAEPGDNGGLVMIQLIKHSNSLVLPSLPNPLRYGYVYEIPRATYEKADIQQAIQRRVIAEVSQAEYDAMVAEGLKEEATVPVSQTTIAQGDTFAARKLAELQRRQGPTVQHRELNNESDLAAIRPESIENIDMTNLSPAERFELTGKAQVFDRQGPKKKESHVFDPHKTLDRTSSDFTVFDPRTKTAVKGIVPQPQEGVKRLIKRAGNVAGGGIGEDGVECDVT